MEKLAQQARELNSTGVVRASNEPDLDAVAASMGERFRGNAH